MGRADSVLFVFMNAIKNIGSYMESVYLPHWRSTDPI